MYDIDATVVFQKLWAAIHARNPDGSRTYRYIKLVGSSRSSKTRSLIQSHYLYAFSNKQKRISVWRSTKKDCKDTVGKDMEIVYPSMPHYNMMTFNRTETIYSTPSKSTIEICGTDDPNKVHGFNGHVLHLNEPYDISRDTFDQLDMRTEEYIVLDLNPKQNHWSDDLDGDPRTIVIHSTFKDNPFCPLEQRIKILSYQPVKLCRLVEDKLLGETEARTYDITANKLLFPEADITELKRCIENENKKSASVYNWTVYGLGEKAERPNRIFFWDEIPDAQYLQLNATKYYGVDWGTVDPWGIVEVKYYDGALYLHELNYQSENEIKEGLSPAELQALYDPHDQENLGLVKWMFNKLGIPKKNYIVCDTNRPMKILALHQAGYSYAVEAPKPPGSILDGINLLTEMKVYYTASSKNLKYEQENYSRMVDRYGVVLEEPEDKDNHLAGDPTRYVAMFLLLMDIIKR